MFCSWFLAKCKNKTSNLICWIRLKLTNDVECCILCFLLFFIMINSFIHVQSLIKQTRSLIGCIDPQSTNEVGSYLKFTFLWRNWVCGIHYQLLVSLFRISRILVFPSLFNEFLVRTSLSNEVNSNTSCYWSKFVQFDEGLHSRIVCHIYCHEMKDMTASYVSNQI